MLGVKLDVSQVHGTMADAMVTITEALLISIALEPSATEEQKKAKLTRQYDKLSAASKQYGKDLILHIQPRVGRETVAKVVG